MFESQKHDIRLHPLCVTLPQTLEFTGHAAHELKLLAHDKGIPYACVACEKRFESGAWRYRCAPCNKNVDLSCVKTEFHKLPEYDADSGARTGSRRSSLSTKVKWATGVAAAIVESVSTLLVIGDALSGDDDDAENGDNGDAVNEDADNGDNDDAVSGDNDDANNGGTRD